MFKGIRVIVALTAAAVVVVAIACAGYVSPVEQIRDALRARYAHGS